MTFTEAAVEVLRLVGKPLHYKKITEVAIERNLLSHVGKTPEVTMSSRLATMVKRDRGEAPIIKVKPGVFGLREFNEEQLADLSGDVDELPEVEVENEQDKAQEARESTPDGISLVPTIEPRKPLPGADVFPEEEDDDEPILGGEEEEDEDDEEAEGEEGLRSDAQPSAESRASRRRRRRRRRGGDEEPEARNGRETRELRDGRSGRERRDERPAREERRREREEPLDFNRDPGDGDLLGKDLADAVASVLSQGGPRGLPLMRVADLLVRRGRLAGDPNALAPTVMAAARADVARRQRERTRARFRIEGNTLILTDFLLPQDVVRAEQEVARAAERQRERARRAFLRRLSELPGAGLAELIATWLNAEGVVGLRAVRRPGASSGELHLAGTLRRGAEEVRLAIVVCRDGRELGRERVIETRGALHYYGNASSAWLIGFGNVTGGAREEASAPGAGPVALYDGLALAAAMEQQGVGLAVQSVAISTLDFELLDALRGPGARERERDVEVRGSGREQGYDERGRERRGREERERPRLVLERPRPPVDEETEAEVCEEDVEEEAALDEGDEVIEAAMIDAAKAEVDERDDARERSDEAAAEGAGEGRGTGRRRRRRRRRKGGRGVEQARGAEAAVPGATEGGEAAGWPEGDDLESDELEADADEDYEESEAGAQDEDTVPSLRLRESDPESFRSRPEARTSTLDTEDEDDEDADDEGLDTESALEGDDEGLEGEEDEADEGALDEAEDSKETGADDFEREPGAGPHESEQDDPRDAYPGRRGHG